MKFRGKIDDIIKIHYFTKIVATLSKLIKTCILRITPNSVYFILAERATGNRIDAWCELQQAHFFSEFNMEGVTVDQNEIYLEVVPDNVLKVLKSAQAAKSVKIKLTKKYGASLTFEIELPSLVSRSKLLTQDVLVSVVPRRLWSDYEEPLLPHYDISILLPPLKTLKNVVDRMKNLNNFMSITASQNGELKLQVETELVTITTQFKDVILNQGNGNTQNLQGNASFLRTDQRTAEARVDIRKFAQLLIGEQLNPNNVICNLLHGRMAHFSIIRDGLTIQYFIPATAA